ncbi:MAG: hypothetical protein AAFU85_27030, partial [Planctomycetota bacterium]
MTSGWNRRARRLACVTLLISGLQLNDLKASETHDSCYLCGWTDSEPAIVESEGVAIDSELAPVETEPAAPKHSPVVLTPVAKETLETVPAALEAMEEAFVVAPEALAVVREAIAGVPEAFAAVRESLAGESDEPEATASATGEPKATVA